MTRLAALTVLQVRQQVLEWSGTWWFLLTLVVQAVLSPLVGLFVWSAVFPSDERIVSYYVALILVTLATESFEQFTFGERIYDGTISHELLKPQPVVIGTVGSNLAIRLWLTLMGAPLVILTGVALGAQFQWEAILRALPTLVLAAVLLFLWTFLLSMAAFWTERVHAVVGFGRHLVDLLGGTAVPLALLPEPWQAIGQALPFYVMLGLPAEIATGQASNAATGVATQLGWVAVLTAAAVVIWRRGTRRYTAVGA